MAPFSRAQLDETWTVTAGGQSAQVETDGSFHIPNVPDYGFRNRSGETRRGLMRYRARGISRAGGNVRVAVSESVPLPGPVHHMPVRYEPEANLESLSLSIDRPRLQIGDTTQLRATARFSDGATIDVSSIERFSTFQSSNPNIADIDDFGLVTAWSEGTAYLRVSQEGATATVRLIVAGPDPLTTIVGFVVRSEGSPVAGARVRVSGSPDFVLTSSDGRFVLPDQASKLGPIRIDAEAVVDARIELGRSALLQPVPGGFTDGGIISIEPDASRLLGFGVDAEDWPWRADGATGWAYTTTNAFDGLDMVVSGALRYNETNSLRTRVIGPGYVSYAWKLTTTNGIDSAYSAMFFVVDGVPRRALATPVNGGQEGWQRVRYLLPDGLHNLEWQTVVLDSRWSEGVPYFCDFRLDPAFPFQLNYETSTTGFLDQVAFFPLRSAAQSPVLTEPPQSQLVTAGDFTELSVSASAVPEPEYQWQRNGTNIARGTQSVLRFESTTPLDEGRYSVIISNQVGSMTVSNIALSVLLRPTLPEAVDSPQLSWETSPGAPWLGQARVTSDGEDAARSGIADNCSESWIQTEVTGPATVWFRWRVSSLSTRLGAAPPIGDTLALLVDGLESMRIGGEEFWRTNSVRLEAGTHTLRWMYSKDPVGSGGRNAGFLDAVSIDSLPWTLAEAADAIRKVWDPGIQDWTTERLKLRSGGNLPWRTNANSDSLDGILVQSGAIGSSQVSWLEAEVHGPGRVVFGWKVSSQTNADFVVFSVGGAEKLKISGERDWDFVVMDVPTGPQVLRWAYQKDGTIDAAEDKAALELITYAPQGEGSLPSLGAALDAPHLAWKSGGSGSWEASRDTDLTRDGRDSARSGAAAVGEASWLETEVTGPGSLTFAWGLIRDNGRSTFRFELDGVSAFDRSSSSSDTTLWQNFATSLTPGRHTLRWTYSKSGNHSGAQGALLDSVSFLSYPVSQVGIADALDATNLVWSTSSDSSWIGEGWFSHDGTDAAQSLDLITNRLSWLEAQVPRPGTLRFLWNVSGGAIDLLVNGARRMRLEAGLEGSGWIERSITLIAGDRTVRWEKTFGHAWLDEVRFEPTIDSAPIFVVQPTSQSVELGRRALLSASATGFPPPYLQWFFGSEPLVSETNATLTIPEVDFPSVGNYSVMASNRAGGVLSAPATLSVSTALSKHIGETLGATNLQWATGGSCHLSWFVDPQSPVKFGPVVRSGEIDGNETSWLRSTIAGPGSLRFRWSIDASLASALSFQLDGTNVIGSIRNFEFARDEEVFIPPGAHVARWEFGRSGFAIVGSNAGYLDSAMFIPDAAPRFEIQPTSQTVAEFSSVTMSVSTTGSPPPSITWLRGNERVTGDRALQPILVFNSVSKFDAGDYSVVASNRAGVTRSAIARLEVIGFAEALNAPTNFLNWRSGGNQGTINSWVADTTSNHDGTVSMRSGPVEFFGTSRLQAEIHGPGTLRFWWQARGLYPSQKAHFLVDGSIRTERTPTASGNGEWRLETIALPAGIHSLTWQIVDGGGSGAAKLSIWVDEIGFVEGL